MVGSSGLLGMPRLSVLSKGVWRHLSQFLASSDFVTLYATGSGDVMSALVESVTKISVGLVPTNSALRFRNLEVLEVKEGSATLQDLHLHAFPQLRRLTLPISMPVSASTLSGLVHLTHFVGALDSLDFLLANSTAPLALLSLLSGEYSVSNLLLLPPTMTSLALPASTITSSPQPLQKPLISSLTSLSLPFSLFNLDLPELGLPESLHTLTIVSGLELDVDFVKSLPRNLEHLHAPQSRLRSESVSYLPKSLKTLNGVTLLVSEPGGFAKLPDSITFLNLSVQELNSLPEPFIGHFPSHLSSLWVDNASVFQHNNLELLPRTVTDLSIPNGMLTGKSVLCLPPHLERLKIVDLVVNDGLRTYVTPWKPSPNQPWYPFFLDPEYIAHLPLSLTKLNSHVYQDIANIMLERLSNNITSWSSTADNVERIVNVLLDLREATSTSDAKNMIDSMREHLSSAVLDVQRTTERVAPARLNIYTVFPHTLEYSHDITDSLGNVSDTRVFMTRVQALYDMLTNSGVSQTRFHETHMILLPSADLPKLQDIHAVFTMHANRRLQEAFAKPTKVFVIAPPSSGHNWTRSKVVTRLSLESFKLYDDVAVGGTFDYMHTGHRMLLSTCLLSARKRLVIGVTGAPLLVKKSHKEYIQAFEMRRRNVELYCKLQRPDLYLELVELLEPAGPTAIEPNFDLIVVSEETAAGIGAINDIRVKKGFKPMEGLIIHLAASYGKMKSLSQDAKVSSTTLRLRQKKLDSYLYAHNPHAIPPPHVQPDEDAMEF